MMSDDVIFPRIQPNWVYATLLYSLFSAFWLFFFFFFFLVCANCRRSIIGRFFGRYKALY